MAPFPQLLEGSGRPLAHVPEAPGRRVLHRAGLSLGPSSDRRLAKRASNGDRGAIAAIFERYQQELYGFCLGILGEPQDAQDALQNTMVKVLKALPGEEREIALRPWLYRVAHNEAVELRRTRRPTQALDGHLLDGQSSVVERAEQRERLDWLLKDLADLPDRQRTALVMRELNGLDFAEIGAALDTSAAVVRQSLYEARRNLEQMGRGRNLRCDVVTRVLSDADGRITRRRDVRAHLRDCPDCQRFQDAIESREGVLAAVSPLPATVTAGFVQAAVGSSSNGVGGALIGGMAKSAGAYGALKAAGTLAAVAVLGTSAIQYGLRSQVPDPGSRRAHVEARSSTSLALSKVKAGRSAHPSLHHQPFASPSGPRLTVASARQVVDRRTVSSRPGHAFAPSVSARAAPAQPGISLAADPPAADVVRESRAESYPPPEPYENGPDHTSKSENQSERGQEKAAKNTASDLTAPPPAQKPEKQSGHPRKPEKISAQEHSAKPETPPGQAKKAGKSEEQTAAPVPPPPVEAEPAAGDVEAPPAAEGEGPNGKAKGHEKHPAS